MFNFHLKLVFLVVYALYTDAAKTCRGTARYTLTFNAEWTSQSHRDFPSNPHFSPLVGCSHRSPYVMWAPGIKATKGVKDVAEFGGTSAINSEMDQQIELKNVLYKYQGSGIRPGVGTSVIKNIDVNSDYPLVSFISMIAPSPDWFVGVHDWNLCDIETGEWRDSRKRDLPLYDAGTDSGLRFASPNMPTVPAENILLITNNTEGSLKDSKPIPKFGTFTFVKTLENKTGSLPPGGTAHPGTILNTTLLFTSCWLNILVYFL